MSYVKERNEGGIVVLTIDRPPVNALDIDTLDELSDAIDDARARDVDGVVITGAGSIFSAGADLQRVLQANPEELDGGIDSLTRNFRTLFTFPRPLVAAVNGPALAGGAVIACACDHRVMARSATIGAIELAAGVPFPSWALEVVRYNVPPGWFQEVTLLARGYRGEDALRVGLVDEVVDEGELFDKALRVARRLARVPRATYALTKRMSRQPTVEHADRVTADTHEDIKAAWRSDEVKAAIRSQLERLQGRPGSPT